MTVIDRKKFQETEGVLNTSRLYTSRAKSFVKLLEDIDKYKVGSEWLLKSNKFTWVVHEYISSKLYKLVLGSKLVTDTVLVSNTEDPSEIKVAVKLADNYQTNFKTFDMFNGEYSPEYILNKKDAVPGFALAYTASRLFEEYDDVSLNNYALKIGKNYENITRFDFDDSFKFFQFRGMELNVPKGKEYPFGWNSFFTNFSYKDIPRFIKKFQEDAEPFIQAFEQLLTFDLKKIMSIVKKGFNEVRDVVGDETFAKHYNFKTLNKLLNPKALEKDNAGKLALFAYKMVSNNFVKLDKMLKCLKVESYLHNNDYEKLNKYFTDEKYSEIKDIECQSYYSDAYKDIECQSYYSDAYESMRPKIIKLEDLVAQYGYSPESNQDYLPGSSEDYDSCGINAV